MMLLAGAQENALNEGLGVKRKQGGGEDYFEDQSYYSSYLI